MSIDAEHCLSATGSSEHLKRVVSNLMLLPFSSTRCSDHDKLGGGHKLRHEYTIMNGSRKQPPESQAYLLGRQRSSLAACSHDGNQVSSGRTGYGDGPTPAPYSVVDMRQLAIVWVDNSHIRPLLNPTMAWLFGLVGVHEIDLPSFPLVCAPT